MHWRIMVILAKPNDAYENELLAAVLGTAYRF
jgi:hypothetical protein